ncbi:MAG TPA: VOC family protein [Bacillota bacterium]|nr:VOC family protein [Bacillota bacterium]
MELHHFAFEVSDLEKAIGFYTETFGMKLMFQEVDSAHGESFAMLSFETGVLELLQRIGVSEPFQKPEIKPPYCPHLAFKTEEMDDLVKKLTAQGVKLAGGPFDNGKGIRWVYFADPDNNIIEFIQVK